jgi:hypothetical protein
MQVMGTSYGISLLVHGVGLFALTLFVFFVPTKTTKATIIAKREFKPKVIPEDRPLDKITKPEIKVEDQVVKPIIVINDEVEIVNKRPKGENLDAQSNVKLDNNNVVDALGVGGGGANAYGFPNGFRARSKPGGERGSTDVIDAALVWFRDHQSPDGRWDADDWQDNCKKGRCSGPGHNKGDSRFDVGVSSLAILAYLGHGQTHRHGIFKRTISRGLDWLKKQQQADGSIGFHAGEEIYNHAIATMAFCEAFAMTRDSRLKKNAQRALNFCIKAQNPGQGWRYGVKPGDNDTSVTGWMVLALKAGRTAKLNVPDSAFEGAQSWFKRVTGSNGDAGYISAGGGSSYIPSQKGKFEEVPCMTAVSVLCRIFTGEKRSNSQIKKGASLLLKSMPKRRSEHRSTNFYYWYYASYALFQVGGQKWTKWKDPMFDTVMSYSRDKGCERGSFDPVSEWSIAGGRVYATAINALTLEVINRYARIRHPDQKH